MAKMVRQWLVKNCTFLLLVIPCLMLLSFVLVTFSAAQNSRMLAGAIDQESFDADSIRSDGELSKQRKALALKKSAHLVHSPDGGALQVPASGWAEYSPVVPLSSHEGAIALWLKPEWNGLVETSHTIVSFKWDDGKNGYFALSQGWWEPAGSRRLYFILNNQQFIHCSLPYRLVPGYWTHLAVTWTNGPIGLCRIYVDGKKVVEKRAEYFAGHVQKGPIFLGSDKGATDRHTRSVEGLFDDLLLFNRFLQDSEVSALYESSIKEPGLLHEKRYSWLRAAQQLPLKPERTRDGVLVETRAIFDEDIGWATSRFVTDKILARIKRAGFNVYVPCVWHGKGTYFPSSFVNPDHRIVSRIKSGDDPLAYLVTRAHSMGIEVHPWFTVTKRSTDAYPQYYDCGTPSGAYNVHNVEFRKFIVDLMIDMVKRYDIDGVNLDYIRTMGICTSDFCRKDYETRSGNSFWVDYKFRQVRGKSRERLQAWQDNAVAQIVEKFALEARQVRPGIIISVDGHPQGKDVTRPLVGRDEVTWANNGWVDIIFAMDYRETIDYETIDRVRDELHDKNKLIVLFGNYEKKDGVVVARSGNLVASYVDYARRKWPGSGVAFYLYGRLSDEQILYLRTSCFTEEAIQKMKNISIKKKK